MAYNRHIRIIVEEPRSARIELPLSKSICNRYLILQALSKGKISIERLSDSKDSQLLQEALLSNSDTIDVQDAGTAYRFLTAYLAVGQKDRTLTGTERMKQRPIKDLVNALREIGAEIEYLEEEGYPPLKIHGKGSLSGGAVSIDSSTSSQFVTALMLIAPVLENGLQIEIQGKISSKSYIDLTASVMRDCGLQVQMNDNQISIPNQDFKEKTVEIEADWSSAAFFYELVGIGFQKPIHLSGLQLDSTQGDSKVQAIAEDLGVQSLQKTDSLELNHKEGQMKALRADLRSTPDLGPAMIIAAACNKGGTFTGLESLAIKESDRVAVLKEALQKMNGNIEEEGGFWKVTPISDPHSKDFNCYDDHRIAMALAPLAYKFGEIEIIGADSVIKSFPNFWEEFSKLGFRIEDV